MTEVPDVCSQRKVSGCAGMFESAPLPANVTSVAGHGLIRPASTVSATIAGAVTITRRGRRCSVPLLTVSVNVRLPGSTRVKSAP